MHACTHVIVRVEGCEVRVQTKVKGLAARVVAPLDVHAVITCNNTPN